MSFPVGKLKLNSSLKCARLLVAYLSSSSVDSKALQLSFMRVPVEEKSKEETKNPIVFLHGLFGHKRNFMSVAKAVSQRTKRDAVCVDLRNHGDSPHTDEMGYRIMSEDVARLMSEQQIQQAIVVGHSMGGKVAMALALLRPNLVEKLVVEDISPGKSRSVETTDFPAYIRTMARADLQPRNARNLSDIRKQVDAHLKPVVESLAVRQFLLTSLEETNGRYRWKINLDSIERHLEDIIGFPRFEECYHGDVLFVGGSKSKVIGAADADEIKRLFPAASVRHIEGAGHWVHSEKPYEFIDMVVDFVKNTLQRSP